MSCPVSTCVALGGLRDVFVEEPLECVVPGGVVGEAVLPAAPDDARPGSSEDADGVWMVVAASSGALVEVFGPGVGSAAVAGEVAQGVAEFLVGRPAEGDGLDFAGLPISASSLAARRVPALGSDFTMGASGWASNCSAMDSASAAIWLLRVRSTATKATVVPAWAWASTVVVPRGAASRRWCSTSGATMPE